MSPVHRQTHRQRFRVSLATSSVVHALALVAIALADGLRLWLGFDPSAAASSSIVLVARADWDRPPERDAEFSIAAPPEDDASHATRPKSADFLDPTDGPSVTHQVERAVEEARKLSPDEQIDRLEQLATRLNQVSSEQTIEELSGKFQQWLGTKPRATRPKDEPVAGSFDPSTAQLHDVQREQLADGEFRYQVVLVDSAGRRLESELGPSEGEQLYKVFQIIKGNPLLERVYRGIVMQILDKMLAPK